MISLFRKYIFFRWLILISLNKAANCCFFAQCLKGNWGQKLINIFYSFFNFFIWWRKNDINQGNIKRFNVMSGKKGIQDLVLPWWNKIQLILGKGKSKNEKISKICFRKNSIKLSWEKNKYFKYVLERHEKKQFSSTFQSCFAFNSKSVGRLKEAIFYLSRLWIFWGKFPKVQSALEPWV